MTIAGMGAAALTFGHAAHAYTCCLPDINNHWVLPEGSAVGYEYIFDGDVTSVIPQQIPDGFTSPFQAMQDLDPSNYQANMPFNYWDPTLNQTHVVLSFAPGSLLLPPTVPPNLPAPHYYHDGHDSFHTGMNAYPTASVHLVDSRWIYDDGSAFDLDAVTVTWTGQVTKKTRVVEYMLTYVSTLDPKTHLQRSGEWRMTPYDPASNKPFVLTNNSGSDVTIGTFGYIPGMPADPACYTNPRCDEIQHDLDNLGADAFPPPGDKGSQFIVLKVPKTPLPPHKAIKLKLRQ
jgi:hypothetical protein